MFLKKTPKHVNTVEFKIQYKALTTQKDMNVILFINDIAYTVYVVACNKYTE